MKNSLPIYAIVAIVLIAFVSCKKNDSITSSAKQPYLVSTVQNTSYGRDSMVYTYTGNTITGMDYYFGTTNGGFYNYVYNIDSNIVWWSWNTSATSQQYSYTMQRNGSKVLSVICKQPYGAFEMIIYKALFKYNGNKLDSVFFTEDYQGTYTLDTSGVYKITYTGDDITKITPTDLSGGMGSVFGLSRNFTYDNTPNGFAAVNKNYWMLGYNYRNTETFDISDVIASLSAHNVISETINGATTNYTYTKDSQGNIIASSGGGRFTLEYR